FLPEEKVYNIFFLKITSLKMYKKPQINNNTTLEYRSFIKEYASLEGEKYAHENFIDNCDSSKYDLNEISLYGKSMQKKNVTITSKFITPEEAAFMSYQERPV